ncbi:MAG: iron-containing alcohol dehydrogenase, partial [Acidobacteriia bacterium]|nr:iron-containing alcohol dehydrogenase [Terriglobia bacterium]
MQFEFATSARIVFGVGAARDLPKAAAAMGRRALLVTGASLERAAALLAGMDAVSFAVAEEPTLDLIRRGVAFARKEGCDLVVAVGGGSAIDAGKALAALTTNHGDSLDYLEVIGRGQPLSEPPLPFIAVPTTAGTGAEVTRNAVLGSPEHHVKASLRSASMLPRLAIVDPELTIT